MKLRSSIVGLMLSAGFLSGCNDDLNYVGGSIQPDEDRIDVMVDSFMMASSTVKIDSIYAKTSSGYLGQFFDPQYGDYKADYICQFYCKEGYTFAHEPLNGKIDSVVFVMLYNSYIGDSLSPMKAEIFPVVKSLDRNYYTNINPEDYCNMQTSLGGQAYTVYNAVKATKNDTIKIRLKDELGQQIYDETINNPSSFANQEAFNRFFPGLYVTNTYGMGVTLRVNASGIMIHYRYEATTTDSKGNDSTYVANTNELFIVTNEVIQLNRMKSYGLDELLAPNNNYTYLKTPAGVYTRLVIPAKKIFERVGDRIINDLPVAIKPLPSSDWEYASSPSSYLLLLPEDSLKTFFEKNKIDDNITSFKTKYSYSSTERIYMYNFGNIARLLKKHKENAPDEDLRVLLIPIETDAATNTYSYYIRNFLRPSGLTLRKDSEVMSIKVTTSKYEK
ncbi:MAG: DUF4270 domain-containing protein [Massilibacteroides sp.]|nr:DUF4270 domain-containing protein [Massilibacteroides sp.]MDD3061535.1 DUF4270 domain-containing protein [Massilibacteroides sp.]MDD4116497.1 DUF4270 domain-containing protein [Massilibacteroides sp.]MDD4659175.1 DUF4270 domain-containing protein [Massilibacteroides sp.]